MGSFVEVLQTAWGDAPGSQEFCVGSDDASKEGGSLELESALAWARLRGDRVMQDLCLAEREAASDARILRELDQCASVRGPDCDIK